MTKIIHYNRMKELAAMLWLLTAFLCLHQVVSAQTPEYAWANRAGGTADDLSLDIAIAESGNTVVTGYFSDVATFGTTTLTSAGGRDNFIAKYDESGNVLWAKRSGGSSLDEAFSIASDESGNIVITGEFIGPSTFGTVTLNGVGSVGVFVAKYDGSGSVLWAKQGGGGFITSGTGIATDGSGNIFVTGWYNGTATFDGIALTSAKLSATETTQAGFCEDFEDGDANGWTPLNATAWNVSQNGSIFEYCIVDESNPSNPDLLGEYTVFDGFQSTDFTFEARARSLDFATENRPDVALRYEFRDDNNYTFIVFNKDFNFTNISKVDNRVRTKLVTSDGSIRVIQDSDYHVLKVTRRGTQSEVFYDGNLVMTATDPSPFFKQIRGRIKKG